MNHIALLCVAVLGLLLFGLGLCVSVTRFRKRIGSACELDPADPLHKLIRAHANTAEYVPFLALLILYLTHTSMNVMSLMGLMILIGMTVSDSILIVEFTQHLREQGMTVRRAVVTAARVRLRPVLMTSFATIIGLLPMALKLGAGSESYAPLARAVLVRICSPS